MGLLGNPRRAALYLGASLAVAAAGWSAPLPPGMTVRELRPGYWLHVTPGPDGYPANGMAVRLADGVLLVDTGWTAKQGVALADWAEATLGAPVRRAIVTHSHNDRAGGAAALRERGITVLALATMTTPIRTESGALEVFFPGAAHAPDNIVVWFPGPRILFGGCMVKADDAETLGNVADADMASWPKAIEALRERYGKADIVVPGHGPVGGPQVLVHTLELLRAK